MTEHFTTVVKGTEHEDTLVILQALQSMIGKRFSFLNYFKEIPVSYDGVLLGIENEMAEFSVHEYQAKVINFERKTLIKAHSGSPFREDVFAEAFYVSSIKKRLILCKFGYASILSGLRRFVRVQLDRPIEADLAFEGDVVRGNVKDISLGGAAINTMSSELLLPGLEINLFLKLPDLNGAAVVEVGMVATINKLQGEYAPYTCIVEFHPEKHSQQQIAYYINQRQVEIIRELKDCNA